MLEHLKAAVPGLGGRAFVDTAPLLEKQLAVEAGLGWIGRQSLLVTPRHGTYVLLGELLLTDEADAYDAPFEGSRCGRCRHCIESCPTGAIVAPKVIDTGRCISCHTIEREPSGGDRPRRLDLRLRLLPELLPLEPARAAAPQRGVRPRVRPADDGRRGMAGDGRNGVRGPLRPHAADPQRTCPHPGKRPPEHRPRRALGTLNRPPRPSPPTRQTRPTRHAPDTSPTQHGTLRHGKPAPAPLLQRDTAQPDPGSVQRRPTRPNTPPAPPNTTPAPRHRPNTAPARPRRARKKRVPEIRNPPYDSRSSANYFDSSASAALALSAAGPAVTFWKAAMACGFISLAL